MVIDRKASPLKFKSIMQEKNITVYDIQLSTGLTSNVINRIIEMGEGSIDEINKIIGCIGVGIEDCLDQDILKIKINSDTSVHVTELFQQRAIINYIQPEKVNLVKSFKGETKKRYVVRLYPLQTEQEQENEEELNLQSKIKRNKVIQTNYWKSSEEALKEFKEHVIPKIQNLTHLYSEFENIEVTEVDFNTEELLLEYYNIIFDPLDNNKILKIGKVYPYQTLKSYNSEYVKKVYAACIKPKTNLMKSQIYSQDDLDFGKIEEHIDLMRLLDVNFSHNNTNIIEFLVPLRFDHKKYFIETTNFFNDFERTKFNVMEYV
jgi:hypothetical protein